MIGETLNHYRIIDKLGEGGMAQVYLADDTRLDRQVALKLLPPELAEDPVRIERFEREAKAVAALNHPNIVTLYSVEEDRGLRFLTMELVDGDSLQSHIPAEGMELPRFFELAGPLLEAVGAAHRRGIIHRDIKPANVMVNSDGVVKLLDLGLARLDPVLNPDAATENQTLTAEGRVIGTVPYMAPEQLAAQALDHRIDIYALGVVFYEMLTGRRPFRAESNAELISAILRDSPEQLAETRASLPRRLEGCVNRCLEKSPEDRYQSIDELKLALAEADVRQGPATPATPKGASPRSTSETGRPGRWLAIAAAIAVVALVAVLALRSGTPRPVVETPVAIDGNGGERPGATEATTGPASATATAGQEASAAPAEIELSLLLVSSLPKGVVTVYADDTRVYQREFRFPERRAGKTRKGAGELEDGMLIPAGVTEIRAYVALAGEPAKQFALDPRLRGDGTDRLRIDIRKKKTIEVTLE